MSPILLRPVREQLEHDRVIRLLQAKYKRKFDVGINPGHEQSDQVLVGQMPWYPDLVLHSPERGRRLLGVVEVETTESVNNLEAMSQWATFGRLRAPFHLYVPSGSIDVAKRLCTDHQVAVAEMWGFHAAGDQVRFTLVHKAPTAAAAPVRREAAAPARQARRAPARRPRAAAASARPSAARGKAARRPSAKKGLTRGASPRAKPPRAARGQKRK